MTITNIRKCIFITLQVKSTYSSGNNLKMAIVPVAADKKHANKNTEPAGKLINSI